MPVTNIGEKAEFSGDPALLAELEERFSSGGIRRRRARRYRSALWLVWVNALDGSKRMLDLAVSGTLLLIFLPVLIAIYAAKRAHGGGLVRYQRLGRWGIVFHEYAFSGRFARHLPSLFNVWRGELSLVGPRAISPGDASAAEMSAWKRFNTRPGLLCLWWIRSRANIAYGTEIGSDVEYVETQSLRGDIGIALRALPAAFYGKSVSVAPDRVSLLGIDINNFTMEEAVGEIVHRAESGVPTRVSFVNADCANIAWNNTAYSNALRANDLVLADGIGMKLAGRLLNRNIRQNVNGTDLLPRLCKVLEQKQLGIFLLGARPGVADDVARWMSLAYPAMPVCGVQHGFSSDEELPGVLASIATSGARVLLVAMGAPRQELWISSHLPQVGGVVALGVGGLFDFYAGRIPRAPSWVREVGMEWAFRVCQEPRRMWRRYFIGNLIFLIRVLREALRETRHL